MVSESLMDVSTKVKKGKGNPVVKLKRSVSDPLTLGLGISMCYGFACHVHSSGFEFLDRHTRGRQTYRLWKKSLLISLEEMSFLCEVLRCGIDVGATCAMI